MYVKPDEKLNALVEEVVRQKMVQKDGWVTPESDVQRPIINYFFFKKQEVNNGVVSVLCLWVPDDEMMGLVATMCIRLCSDHGELEGVCECA